MLCFGGDAMCWCLCNVWVLMQCSNVNAKFGCSYTVPMLTQCSGVDAKFLRICVA